MKKIINIILYTVSLVAIIFIILDNPYLGDLYKEKNINSNKTFNKYYDNNKFVCIDLKNSEMTRFKVDKQDDSIVYISNYSDKNFISILTKGTSLSDKVCGMIKKDDSLSIELKKSLKDDKEIVFTSKYFTNYNIKKEKLSYQIVLYSMFVLAFLFIVGIIGNIILLLRKKNTNL